MKTTKLFIESSDNRTPDGSCWSSELRGATDEEIILFKSKECDHSAKELLIYDEPGYMYDFRFCGVCNSPIGLI